MAQLITDAYLKQTTSIQSNVRDLSSFIVSSEELFIRPTLGSKLLQQLHYQIDNGTLVSNSDLYILYESYIKPAIAYYAAYLAINSIHYQVTSTGVIVRGGGDNEPIDKETLSAIQSDYKNMGDIFIKTGLDFIERNIGSFQSTYVLEFKTKHTDGNKPRILGSILFNRKGGCK